MRLLSVIAIAALIWLVGLFAFAHRVRELTPADDPARADAIVPYPQYWVWRLSGAKVSEATSLGCHTDLWNPHSGQPSPLLAALGLTDKLAPPRRPADVLGQIDGTIKVTELLYLKGSCQINGNIYAGQLQVDATASFNGECHMGAAAVSNAPLASVLEISKESLNAAANDQ